VRVQSKEFETTPKREGRHKDGLISFVLSPRPRERWLTRLLLLETAILLSIWCHALPAEQKPVAVPEWQTRGLVAALTDPNRQTWVGGIFLEIAPITAILESLKDSDKTKFTEYLATVLTDDAVSVRYAAATVLGQLDDQQAAPQLIKLLHDPDPGVCFAAAAALGRLGNQLAAPDLIKLLHDPNPNVRETAAAALGQLGDQQATPELIKLLHDQKPFVRAAADAALGRLGNEQGAPELIKFLHDPDPRIRDTAAAAIGQLGDQQAAAELIKLLLDPDYMVRATAVASLGQLDDKQVAPEVVKLLLDSDPDARARAATVLGQLDDKQVAPELVETLHDPDPGVRDTAVAALGKLGDKQVAPELINLLHAPDHEARAAAAIALGQLGDTQIAPELVKLLLDGDNDVRAAAATTLGQLGDKQATPELIKSLRDFVPNVRAAALTALLITGPVDLNTLPAILNRAYGNEEEVGETRFDAHLLGGGQPDVELAIGCLGKNAPASCQLARLSSSDARRYLKVFRQVWDSSREYPEVRDDSAEKIAELARTQGWTSEDLWDLKYLRAEMLRQGGSSQVAANSIPTSPNYIFRWLVRYGYAGAAQPIFWIALIFLYPRFPSVQAIFFWNPRIRRFLGFGYVGLLLTWVPFLRNRLLAPFRDSLLADAESQNFDPEAYFAECSVVLKPGGHPEPIARAIPEIEGEIILEGESGLGKTMFLRSLAKRAERPMVYLTAQRCNGGVIEAIQDKLFGYAQDKTFLQSLVYSGGIDVAIDGLNEVSPDTRAQVSSFIEHYLRANVIVGTQPLEWTPPKTAKLYALQRLTQEQIRAFLLSREVILPEDAVRKGDE
jgi:HEAT repeat protein